jgi:hypothetical protein
MILMGIELEEQDFEAAWVETELFVHWLHQRGRIEQARGHLAVVKGELIPVDRGPELRAAVVFERSIGREGWEQDYCPYARTKAVMAARDRRSNRLTIRRGGSLQIGDCRWAGAVYGSGHGFGFSGLKAYTDERVARFFLAAAYENYYARQPESRPDEHFVGGQPHASLVDEEPPEGTVVAEDDELISPS